MRLGNADQRDFGWIATRTRRGGLDAFLIKAKADVLSPRARELKRAIEKKLPKAEFVKKAG